MINSECGMRNAELKSTSTSTSTSTSIFLAMMIVINTYCMMIFVGCGDFFERTYVLPDFVIKFDARGDDARCGGLPCGDIKTAYSRIVPLPTPVRPGYVFEGWYADTVGGHHYGGAGTAHTVEAKNVTMYAHWEPILKIDAGDSVTAEGIVIVRVPAGMFVMGSPISESGRHYDEDQKTVEIEKDFWISKYPITNRQIAEIRRINSITAPAWDFPDGREDYPVVGVSLAQADYYAALTGGTLPTEAQWEYAARGGSASGTRYYVFSGSDFIDPVAWYAGNSTGKPHRVGPKLPPKLPNQLGLYDMSGNVFEWCGLYGYDPAGDPTSGAVLRGGGWNSPAAACRSAARTVAAPETERDDIGFRIVFEAK